MRRVLALWLPQLPLDRRARLGDDRLQCSFAIVAEIRSALRITHLSEAAARAGLTPGLSLTDARAICPALLTEPADPVREESLLRALHRWADSLSPVVGLDLPDGLILDITGCAHLFGGEREMAVMALNRLEDLQIKARAGIADTKGGARALARFGPGPVTLAAPGELRGALSGLPLAALGLPDSLTIDLRRTGLQTIGQLYDIRAAELTRRFGFELTATLQRTLGFTPDPLVCAKAEPVYAARATLPEPIGYLADLERVLARLADAVCARLANAGAGARRFHLTVRCVDSGDHHMMAGFARPTAAPDALLQQFRAPLDKLRITFGADGFRLLAELVEPLHPHQRRLDRATEIDQSWSDLVSTLGNRLGHDRVRLFQPADSHLPEREYTTVEAMAHAGDPVWTHGPRPRPIRIYDRPEPLRVETPGRPPLRFEWRRTFYETEAAEGPERLAGEWWRRGDRRLRDYWRVQTRAGPRLWLLHYPGREASDWYVAGWLP